MHFSRAVSWSEKKPRREDGAHGGHHNQFKRMSEPPIGESLSAQADAGPELELLMQGYQRADRAAAETLMELLIPRLSRFFQSMPDGRHGSPRPSGAGNTVAAASGSPHLPSG